MIWIWLVLIAWLYLFTGWNPWHLWRMYLQNKGLYLNGTIWGRLAYRSSVDGAALFWIKDHKAVPLLVWQNGKMRKRPNALATDVRLSCIEFLREDLDSRVEDLVGNMRAQDYAELLRTAEGNLAKWMLAVLDRSPVGTSLLIEMNMGSAALAIPIARASRKEVDGKAQTDILIDWHSFLRSARKTPSKYRSRVYRMLPEGYAEQAPDRGWPAQSPFVTWDDHYREGLFPTVEAKS